MAKGPGNKKRKWQDVNAAQLEKEGKTGLLRSGCGCDIPIFTFRTIGQTLEGRIRPCYKRDRNDRARCAHVHGYSEDGKDTTVAIRMSAMLWAAIARTDPALWGRWIRITYKGVKPMAFRRAMKLYLVEFDKGTLAEDFEPVPVRPEDCKSPKPRKGRPICSGV